MRIDPKVMLLAKKLNIKIIKTNDIRAEWKHGNEILINPKKATNYDVLHEISHSICGHSCCREHCEFEAHGGAKVLLKLLGLRKGDAERRMDGYAGRSSHESCGRIEKNRLREAKWKKKHGKRLTKSEQQLLKGKRKKKRK